MRSGFFSAVADAIFDGGTISGDLVVDGDLTVNGNSTGAYDELVSGNLAIGSEDKLFLDGGGDTYIQEDSANNILFNSSTATFSGTVTADSFSTTGNISGNITATQLNIEATGDLRLEDTTGGEYVALQAPGTVTSYTVTMPGAVGSSGQALRSSDGSGTLEWYTPEEGDITSVVAGTGLSGGGTAGDVTLNLDGVTVALFEADAVQLSSESFSDNNTSLMTSAAIADKIESYGYTTEVGDITSVVAGTGLSGGGSSGDVTLNLDGVTVALFEADAIQLSNESFSDNDTSVMTSAAIANKIEAYGYTTEVGDITSVVAGTGLSGGGASGDVTLNVSGLTLSELAGTSVVIESEGIGNNDNDTTLATSAAIIDYVAGEISSSPTALSGMTDANITSPADASLLLYDTGTSKWRDGAMSGDATIGDTGAITLTATNTNLTTLANVTTVGAIASGSWEATDVAVAHGGTGASTAGNARTNLGVAVGSDVQAYHATLDTVSDGTYAGDDNIVTVGTIATGTWEGDTVAVAQGGTGATSLNNLITLTTHTTGDYVGTITGGAGIDSDAATSGEGTTHTLSLDLNELATETSIADEDFIVMVDATDDGSSKITFENLEDSIFSSVSGDILITEAGVSTIQSNSVALSTDTTGDYVSTITGGTGITSSGNTSGEGIAHSLSVDASQTQVTAVGALDAGTITSGFGSIDSGSSTITTTGLISGGDLAITGSSTTIGTVTSGVWNAGAVTSSGLISGVNGDFSGDLTVDGDLLVSGDSVTVNTANITVEDPLIKLASGNDSADTVDIGFYGLCDPTGSQDTYTGLARDASDAKYHLFDLLQAEPTTTINISGAGFDHADLHAGTITSDDGFVGDLTGNADTVTTNANLTGHVTSSGNAAVLGSFTVAQLSTALSDASISGNNTGDQTLPTDFVSKASGGTFGGSVTATGSFIIGDADMNEADLEKLDGITNGAGAANKALVLDGNADVASGLRNMTLSGIADAVNYKVSGAQGSDGEVLTSTGAGVAWEALPAGGVEGLNSSANATWLTVDSSENSLFAGVVTASGFTIGSAAITEAEFEILDGATVTTSELNILDGVTSTTAELNILDGVTSTAAELNILDGVTSTASELNILDGVTSTAAELNILDGVTSTTAELNILDGVTATTAEINYIDGVTSALQAQLDAKLPLTGGTLSDNLTIASNKAVYFGDSGEYIYGSGTHMYIASSGQIYLSAEGLNWTHTVNSNALSITKSGTGNSLNIVHSGSQNAISVDNNSDAGNAGIQVENTGARGPAIYATSDMGSNQGDPLVWLVADNENFDKEVLHIQNDGTQPAIVTSGAGNGGATFSGDISLKNGASVFVGEAVSSNSTEEGIYWHNEHSDYGIYRTSGSWSGNIYQQLKIDWGTGIIMNGGNAYGASGVSIESDLAVAQSKKLYLDGGVGGTGDTFLWSNGSNQVDLHVGGTKVLQWTAANFSVEAGYATFADTVTAVRYRVSNTGSDSTPAYSFSAGTDTGMYQDSTNKISFTNNGSKSFELDASGNGLFEQDLSLENGKSFWLDGYDNNLELKAQSSKFSFRYNNNVLIEFGDSEIESMKKANFGYGMRVSSQSDNGSGYDGALYVTSHASDWAIMVQTWSNTKGILVNCENETTHALAVYNDDSNEYKFIVDQAGTVDLRNIKINGSTDSDKFLRSNGSSVSWEEAGVSGLTNKSNTTWLTVDSSEDCIFKGNITIYPHSSGAGQLKIRSNGTQEPNLQLWSDSSGSALYQMYSDSSKYFYTFVDGQQQTRAYKSGSQVNTEFKGEVIINDSSNNGFFTAHGSSKAYQVGNYHNKALYYNDTHTIGFNSAGIVFTGGVADFNGTVDAANFKVSGAQGSDGQVLTSTGSGVQWESASASDTFTSAITVNMSSHPRVRYSVGGSLKFQTGWDTSNNEFVLTPETSDLNSTEKGIRIKSSGEIFVKKEFEMNGDYLAILDPNADSISSDVGLGRYLKLASPNSKVGILFGGAANNYNPWEIYMDNGSNLHFYGDGDVRMNIAFNGNVTGSHGNYHVSSDERLKKDIVTIPDALDKVLALRGVNFKWKDEEVGTNLMMGLIAQETESVIPEVVHTQSKGDKIKAVEYQFIVGVLIEAVKELNEKVVALENA